MKNLIFFSKGLFLLSLILFFGSCNKNEEIKLLDGEQSDFIVKSSSGDKIVLDRTWYRDCMPVPSMPNTWSSSQRTLSSNELSTTEFFYDNSNCSSNLVMVNVTVAKLVIQEEATKISWVEMDGATPASTPAGLENVTEANSINYTVATAKMTPITQAQANLLNTNPALGFGLTDWQAGVTKDVQPILSQFANPGGATIVVLDDNTGQGCVYDGIPDFSSTEKYPSKIGIIPHCGPLHTK